MEAVFISGAQGLNTEGLGEGGDLGRRNRHHSIDAVGRSFSFRRSAEGIPLKDEFLGDALTAILEPAPLNRQRNF